MLVFLIPQRNRKIQLCRFQRDVNSNCNRFTLLIPKTFFAVLKFYFFHSSENDMRKKRAKRAPGCSSPGSVVRTTRAPRQKEALFSVDRVTRMKKHSKT